jgi:hypothetical protein
MMITHHQTQIVEGRENILALKSFEFIDKQKNNNSKWKI